MGQHQQEEWVAFINEASTVLMSKILHKYLTRSLFPTCSSFPQRWQWQPTVRVTWELGQQVTNCFHTGLVSYDELHVIDLNFTLDYYQDPSSYIWTLKLLYVLASYVGFSVIHLNIYTAHLVSYVRLYLNTQAGNLQSRVMWELTSQVTNCSSWSHIESGFAKECR